MQFTPALFNFIEKNRNADSTALLLKEKRGGVNEFDLQWAIEQIEARKRISDKLPTWANNFKLLFPAKICAEQASSECTAQYKQQFVPINANVCDLTGGLGIDSYYLAHKATRHIYVERYAHYYQIAQHNFKELGASNIELINCNAEEYLKDNATQFDLLYIDPARRSTTDKRLYALESCEPNILAIMPLLLSSAQTLLIKTSPMIDIAHAIQQLPPLTAIHIVSVKNECKEVLFYLHSNGTSNPISITCTNFTTQGTMMQFSYLWEEEQMSKSIIADKILNYLYEPNSAILKAGAFKLSGERFNLAKLAVSSHLYTSSVCVEDFPGRIFKVIDILAFSSKLLKTLATQYPKANIITRNFIMSADELRKRAHIIDGGEIYLIATTLTHDQRVIAVAIRI